MATDKGAEVDEVKLISKHNASAKKQKSPSTLLVLSGIFLVLAIIVIIIYAIKENERDCVGILQVNIVKHRVYISAGGQNTTYLGEIGKNLGGQMVQRKPTRDGFEYKWENGQKLAVKDLQDNCTSIHWSGMENLADTDLYPLDCFVLKDKHWYGGAELYKQVWPFEKAVVEMAPYYPQDTIAAYYEKIPAFGPVLGRYWVNSQGIAIIVNQTSPLVVSINAAKSDGQLCLTIEPRLYPHTSVAPELNYTVCKGKDVKEVHQAMVKKYFKKIVKGPDEKMMRDPVWSTWVKYHKEVNQYDVEQFLHQIVANKFPCSQVEIDDKYTTTYGDYDFDPLKFPDPKGMVKQIHDAGCRVTAWVHPFAEVASKAYIEGKNLGYFVVGSDGKTPGLFKWWNGQAAAVDVTKPAAYAWFLKRLKEFQVQYSVDSFKFDAGSVTYLPSNYTLYGTTIPSNYSVMYAKLASDINNMVEVRVGDHSQDLPVFVRFLDRDATWDTAMGLQSVIPTVLTFGILGYPFILPDMIGGNGDPDKELFIRWMQLNTFLPSMQFSHAPWDFDDESIAIGHKMMDIRAAIMQTLLSGVENAIKTGEPIIRPLWWVAPEDSMALTVDQQFMVTDVYLIAPVVTAGATSINVYLPKGIWMEEFGNRVKHTMAKGGTIGYNVTSLSDVFYFRNMQSLK